MREVVDKVFVMGGRIELPDPVWNGVQRRRAIVERGVECEYSSFSFL